MTARFEDIISLVPADAHSVAEVGYDHGKLLAMLWQKFPHLRLTGVEKQPYAAARFWRRAEGTGISRERLELLWGDGLVPLRDRQLEVLLLAGLSEGRIVEILSREEDVLARCRRLILAPLRPQALLRPFLAERGWSFPEERLCRYHGRYYQAYAAVPKPAARLDKTWLIGSDLFRQRHPLLPEFLARLRESHALAARKQERSAMLFAAAEKAMRSPAVVREA